MAKPKRGDSYRHTADAGLGARARDADGDLVGALPTEMAQLDMPPGAVVTVTGVDDDRGLVLLEWTDGNDTPRITSVDPEQFARDFEKGE